MGIAPWCSLLNTEGQFNVGFKELPTHAVQKVRVNVGVGLEDDRRS